MRRISSKTLHLAIVLFLVSIGAFLLLQLTPGDPALTILGPNATAQTVRQIDHQLGIDRPLLDQYGRWIDDAVHGNLGQSLVAPYGSVASQIRQALPVTIELAVLAELIALGVAIPAGIWSAYRAGGRADSAMTGTAYALISIPTFLAGLLLAYLLTVRIHLFPRVEWVRITSNPWSNLHHAILPAFTLSLTELAVYTRLLRSDMLTTLSSEFIEAAKARGLSNTRVLLRHALRPSSFSLVTLSGISLGRLIGGALIVEVIFSLPGVGQLLVTAVGANNYPVVQGIVLIVAVIYVVVNALIDVSYGFLDPRTRSVNA